MSQFFGMPVIS